MKVGLLAFILAVALFLCSCATTPSPIPLERSYPIILKVAVTPRAAVTADLGKIEGILTLEESGEASFAVTAPAPLAGFVFTAGEAPAVSHGSVTAPLPQTMPILDSVIFLFSLDATSVSDIEPMTLGGMSYNRVTCVVEADGGDVGEALFYLTAEGRLARIEYDGLILDVPDRA